MVMWMAPSLPRTRPADPIQLLVRAILTDHSRIIIWGESHPDVVPAALPRVMEESGVTLNWVFTGDREIQLVDARPTYLEGARGLELVYKDVDGHTVTYVIMPATSPSPRPVASRSIGGGPWSAPRAGSASSCGSSRDCSASWSRT